MDEDAAAEVAFEEQAQEVAAEEQAAEVEAEKQAEEQAEEEAPPPPPPRVEEPVFQEETGLHHRGHEEEHHHHEEAATTTHHHEEPHKPHEEVEEPKVHHEVKEGLVQRMLKTYLPMLLNMLHYVEVAINVIITVSEHANRLYNVFYKKVEHHLPDQIVKLITGLVIMFFGGFFITTVACIEAFRQGGSDRLYASIATLREQAKEISEANEADNEVDDNNDGIPDVQQISKEALTQRKLLVFVKACDPGKLSEALAALYTCILAVVATLRVQFARTISLGAAIGDNLYKPVEKFLIPMINFLTPKDYHKWYPSIFHYICRAIGASIAFQIQRVLSTVATAVRGGHMVIESSAVLTQYHGVSYLTDGYLDDILVWILVVFGIYFQIFVFTFLPSFLKLILLPFFIVEFVLTTVVTTVPV